VRSFESKVDASERNYEKLMRDGANFVGPRLGKALDSHYLKILEEEYGKPNGLFTEKKSAQLAQSLNAYDE